MVCPSGRYSTEVSSIELVVDVNVNSYGNKVYDIQSMTEEFENELSKLVDENTN